MESLGVGRPSTYASILGSITTRKYVEIKKRMLVPTRVGEDLFDWADRSCPWVVDFDMTRSMEETLDQVEKGSVNWRDFVREVHEKMGFENSPASSGETPTEKQVQYAKKIAIEKGLVLPEKTVKNRKELSAWN